jgi:SHS2 domain-containing protein
VTAAQGYEYFEVEADVGVHAWAPTLAGAFAQAALGSLALAVEPSEVEERETREVRAQGGAGEALLVSWVNECLYVHEIEEFVVRRVEIDTLQAGLVHGTLYGEAFDPARHRPGTVVKAATLHATSIRETPGRVDVRLVLDV